MVESKQSDALTHVPRRSSHILKLSYSPSVSTLAVTFKNGKTYTHAAVPRSTFDAFTRFPSPGTYYHRFVQRYKLI